MDAEDSTAGALLGSSVTKEELVQNTLESLKLDDLGRFQDSYVHHDELTAFKAFEGVSFDEYRRKLEAAFKNSKKAIKDQDQNVKELRLIEVEEPYFDSYERNINVVYFNAIVQNQEGQQFKLRFSECFQLPNAIRLAGSLKMEKIE